MVTGSCLCGAVAFEVHGDVRPPVACHCTQCRKTTGHYWAAASAASDAISVVGDVAWFRSSPTAERGFCPTCGSTLFWRLDGEGRTSFSAGAIDGPTGMALQKHIFVADQGDYYEIAEQAPQREN